MSQWEGKSKGNKLGYSIVFYVCKTFGVLPAYFLLRFVALYFFLFSWSSTPNVYHYFRHRQKMSRWRSIRSTYRNYYVFGQSLLDKVVVMAGIDASFTFHFDGEENLKEIVDKGKGGILLSAHVGNWEAAGHLLKRLNSRVNVVMFDGEHQQIKQYVERITGGRNFNVIVIKDDMSHVYHISEALAKNEMICLLADRYMPGNKTASLNFLDTQAQFPQGPFSLAAGFKVPVSFVFAFKETAKHYHLFGSKLLERHEGESGTEFKDRLMTSYVKELEQKMRRYPEQWFNYYNFWSN
jgi:predicted LPLAT superfamily acyltransferase